jgi:hypothetical protein
VGQPFSAFSLGGRVEAFGPRVLSLIEDILNLEYVIQVVEDPDQKLLFEAMLEGSRTELSITLRDCNRSTFVLPKTSDSVQPMA